MNFVGTVVDSIELIERIVSYIQKVKNAPSDILRLKAELRMLQSLLRDLQDNQNDAIHGLQGSPLLQFEEALKIFEAKLGSTFKQKSRNSSSASPNSIIITETSSVNRFLWPTRANDVKELLQLINRYVNYFELAMDGALLNSSKALERDMSDVKTSVESLKTPIEEVSRNIGQLKEANSASGIQHFLKMLNMRNFSSRVQAAYAKWLPGTTTQSLNESTYQDWINGKHRNIICLGIPGAGKTVLAARIVQSLHLDSAVKGFGVGYLFFTFDEPNDTVETLLATILGQLIAKCSEIHDEVSRKLESLQAAFLSPTYSDLTRMIEQQCGSFQKIFIIVDALDNCSDFGTRSTRSCLLNGLYEIQSRNQQLRILITARKSVSPQLFDRFPDRLNVEVRASDADLRIYVRAMLESESRLVRIIGRDTQLETLKRVIEDAVVEQSGEMFLLAFLHMESLMTKRTPNEIRKAVKNLPENIFRHYDSIVERIESSADSDLGKRSLELVCFATEPLTLKALEIAISSRSGQLDLNEGDLIDGGDIISACCGLLMVEEKDQIVRLVHSSAYEYFQDNSRRLVLFPCAEYNMALTCLTYFLSELFDKEYETYKRAMVRFDYSGFIRYCARNFIGHIKRAQNSNLNQFVRLLINNEKKRRAVISTLGWEGKPAYRMFSGHGRLSESDKWAHFGFLMACGNEAIPTTGVTWLVTEIDINNLMTWTFDEASRRMKHIAVAEVWGCFVYFLATGALEKADAILQWLQTSSDEAKRLLWLLAAGSGFIKAGRYLKKEGLKLSSFTDWMEKLELALVWLETTDSILPTEITATSTYRTFSEMFQSWKPLLSLLDRGGYNALHHAIDADQPLIVLMLLSHGVDIEARTASFKTPFLLSAGTRASASMLVLIHQFCNLQAKDMRGSNALHIFSKTAASLLKPRYLLASLPHPPIKDFCFFEKPSTSSEALSLVDILVNDANLSIHERNSVGRTPIEYTWDKPPDESPVAFETMFLAYGAEVTANCGDSRFVLNLLVGARGKTAREKEKHWDEAVAILAWGNRKLKGESNALLEILMLKLKEELDKEKGRRHIEKVERNTTMGIAIGKGTVETARASHSMHHQQDGGRTGLPYKFSSLNL